MDLAPRAIGRIGVALSIALLLSASGRADAPAGSSEEAADRPAIFGFGSQQIGLNLGYAHGVDFASSGVIEGRRVRALVVLPHWQIDLTRRLAPRTWYGGVLSFRSEAELLVNFEPRSGVAGGLGLLLRYGFLGAGRTYPYLQGGAGVIGLDFDLADQADGLAFIPQAGVGLIHRLDERFSLDLGFRFHHISNAYTQSPNGGIDALQVLLGVAYRLE